MIPLLITGLPVGAMYGLAALGLVVVHRATRNVDLSLGAVATTAAFVFQRLSTDASLPTLLAAFAALAVAGAIGLAGAVVAGLVGPDRPLAAAVASLALAGLVLAACTVGFGTGTEFVAPLFPDVRVEVAGAVLSGHQLAVLAAAIVVAGGTLLLRRTATGMAWTAVAGDRVGAGVVGIPVRRAEISSYVVAALLSGLGGILLAPLLFLDTVQLTVFFLVKPFVAAVVAGLASLPSALAAGLAIGILESLSVRVQDIPGLGEAVPFALVALALVRRERRARETLGNALDRSPSRLPGQGRVWPALALVGALLLLAPHQSPYQATITQLAGVTALLAATHVVMTGWAGELSLAQPALAGIGAITAARLGAGAGLHFPLTILAGAVAGTLAAAVVGVPAAARATGLRFAALTLAFSTACAGMLFLWPPFAGGHEGRTLASPAIGSLALAGPRYTWVVVIAAACAFAGLRALARSPWGAALIATREHERAAVALGVPTSGARWVAFTITGGLAGLAGALSAHQLQTVAVEQFHPLTALPVLSAAAVGGFESLWGAVVGATFVTLAPEALRHTAAPSVALFVGPVALLLTVLLRPGGITSFGRIRAGHRRRTGGTGEADGTPAAGDALVVGGLRVNYGDFEAAAGVDLSVVPGEVVALIGPNGAGKTTVLDAVSGFVAPAAGRVVVGGCDLVGQPARKRAAAGVVRTFQSGGLFPRLTLQENVDLARRWHRLSLTPDDFFVAAGLGAYGDRPARDLPHGTARLAEILRAVSLRPKVLLLDEPAAGLGRKESEGLIDFVRERAAGAAVLLVEHDQHVVALADRAVVLHLGRVLATGPPDVVLADPAVVAAYLGTTPESPPEASAMPRSIVGFRQLADGSWIADDHAAIPDGLVRARTAGPFDAKTVPAGLRTWHRVAEATWGCLCVLEGSLTITFDLDPPLDIRVTEGARQPIPPGLRHLVTLDGPARFTVEFFAAP